jgi:hypothetical protein
MANAEWIWLKSIDCSTQCDATSSSLRELCSDPSGNLYFNCYFGTPTSVFKVANPLNDTPTITTFCTPAGDGGTGSTYTGLVCDNEGNLFTGRDTASYDTSWIDKYNSSGGLVSSFGVAGRVSPVTAGAEEQGRRPWHLSWTGPSTDMIMITLQKARPEQIALIDADTGANADFASPFTSLNCYSDENNNGSIDDEVAAFINDASVYATGKYHGHCYDESTGIIYADGGRKLVAVSSSGTADLTDLTTYDTYTLLSSVSNYKEANENELAYDRTSGLIAYTAGSQPVEIAVYDTNTDTLEMVNIDGNLPDYSYGLAFFRSGENLYLAVNDQNINSPASQDDIEIFKYNTPTPVPPTSTPSSGIDNAAWEIYY